MSSAHRLQYFGLVLASAFSVIFILLPSLFRSQQSRGSGNVGLPSKLRLRLLPTIVNASIERELLDRSAEQFGIFYEWKGNAEFFTERNMSWVKKSGIHTHSQSPIYPSQYGQDEFVAAILTNRPPEGFFFIDLAASHWKDNSNTYALEKFHGFRGICIEPNDEYLLGLVMNRTCTVIRSAVSSHANKIVRFRLNGLDGGIIDSEFDNKPLGEGMRPETESDVLPDIREIIMNTTTLTNIMDFFAVPAVIDYLSLDVEGAEAPALEGFDFSRYKARLISVERPAVRVHSILTQHGYWWLFNMKSDCFYMHQSHENFTQTMNAYREVASVVWHQTRHEYLLHPEWPPRQQTLEQMLSFDSALKSPTVLTATDLSDVSTASAKFRAETGASAASTVKTYTPKHAVAHQSLNSQRLQHLHRQQQLKWKEQKEAMGLER